jgi:hypothetical protein
VLANGFLTREIYEDLPGTDIASLTDSAAYQEERYDRLAAVTSFQTPIQDGVFYGQSVWGYLTAPESGDDVFRLSAADSAELWLSKDEVSTNTALIARVLVPTKPYQWTNDFYQTSGAITLQAGQAYYVEVLHKAGATNDHVEVAWTPPSRSGTVNALEIIPGDYLATYVNPDVAQITITQQPTNVNVPEFRTATFGVVATGSSYLGTNMIYQWLRDGASIPGAKSAIYTTPPVKAADHQSRYQCAVSVPGKTVYSDEAVLTVIEAVDLPALQIARQAANAVISWITTATNLVLESQTNLVVTNWVVAPEPVVRNGNTNQVATPAQDTRFFRLRSP